MCFSLDAGKESFDLWLLNTVSFDDSMTTLPIRVSVFPLPWDHIFSALFLLLALGRNKNGFEPQPRVGGRPRVTYLVSTGSSAYGSDERFTVTVVCVCVRVI